MSLLPTVAEEFLKSAFTARLLDLDASVPVVKENGGPTRWGYLR